MTDTPIGNEIRRWRFERGEMTQQALADVCGVTRQTIIALDPPIRYPQRALGPPGAGAGPTGCWP